jgi:hypothetical protein
MKQGRQGGRKQVTEEERRKGGKDWKAGRKERNEEGVREGSKTRRVEWKKEGMRQGGKEGKREPENVISVIRKWDWAL